MDITNISAGGISTSSVRDTATLSSAARNRAGEEARTPEVYARPSDTVDISALARRLGLITNESASAQPFRSELVNRIKSEIEAGTYDTPEKLDIASDRLIRELDITA